MCIYIHMHVYACISSVQSLSRVLLFVTPWTAARQASLSITNSQSLPKPMSIKSVMPYNHFILCCPLLLLPSIFPSIRGFSNESGFCIRWPKYWSFSFNFSPSNEHPGLISFRMDWLDLLAVQGTLKSLLQQHSSKASILQHSAFFIVQCSHPYMTTGKAVALTRWSFVDKVMSLLFNMLSRLVITFLPRSKHLLISWLQSPSAVILEPRKNKVYACVCAYNTHTHTHTQMYIVSQLAFSFRNKLWHWFIVFQKYLAIACNESGPMLQTLENSHEESYHVYTVRSISFFLMTTSNSSVKSFVLFCSISFW